jgi:hypothetical protein
MNINMNIKINMSTDMETNMDTDVMMPSYLTVKAALKPAFGANFIMPYLQN